MENLEDLQGFGFKKIDGKIVQTNIGKIEEFDDYVEVECLGGCTEEALRQGMKKIANETSKPVKSAFNGILISEEPEK